MRGGPQSRRLGIDDLVAMAEGEPVSFPAAPPLKAPQMQTTAQPFSGLRQQCAPLAARTAASASSPAAFRSPREVAASRASSLPEALPRAQSSPYAAAMPASARYSAGQPLPLGSTAAASPSASRPVPAASPNAISPAVAAAAARERTPQKQMVSIPAATRSPRTGPPCPAAAAVPAREKTPQKQIVSSPAATRSPRAPSLAAIVAKAPRKQAVCAALAVEETDVTCDAGHKLVCCKVKYHPYSSDPELRKPILCDDCQLQHPEDQWMEKAIIDDKTCFQCLACDFALCSRCHQARVDKAAEAHIKRQKTSASSKLSPDETKTSMVPSVLTRDIVEGMVARSPVVPSPKASAEPTYSEHAEPMLQSTPPRRSSRGASEMQPVPGVLTREIVDGLVARSPALPSPRASAEPTYSEHAKPMLQLSPQRRTSRGASEMQLVHVGAEDVPTRSSARLAGKQETPVAQASPRGASTPQEHAADSPAPRRRLVVKTRSPTPGEFAMVPVDEVWQMSESPMQTTPRKKRTFFDRGLQLVEVSLEVMADDCRSPNAAEPNAAESDLACSSRPKRMRMAPIEHWRGERIVLHRPPGSPLPEIRGVMLNASPHPLLSRSPMVSQALKDGDEQILSLTNDASIANVAALEDAERQQRRI